MLVQLTASSYMERLGRGREEQPLRVLLVEDDEDDYVIVRDLLAEVEEGRYELEWASSYDAGVEALESGKFVAALVDYRLGTPDGIDLLRQAQALDSRVPIIVLTGKGDRSVDVRAMEAGAADYLDKAGLDARALERAIRHAVDRMRLVEGMREHEELFLLAERCTADGIWDWKLDSNLVHYSARWLELLGIERRAADASLSTWFSRVHPDDLPPLKKGMAAYLNGEEERFECDLRMRHGDDGYRWFCCRGVAVQRATGEVVRLVGTLTDITDSRTLRAAE